MNLFLYCSNFPRISSVGTSLGYLPVKHPLQMPSPLTISSSLSDTAFPMGLFVSLAAMPQLSCRGAAGQGARNRWLPTHPGLQSHRPQIHRTLLSACHCCSSGFTFLFSNQIIIAHPQAEVNKESLLHIILIHHGKDLSRISRILVYNVHNLFSCGVRHAVVVFHLFAQRLTP